MNLQTCPLSPAELTTEVERLVQERSSGRIRNLRVDVEGDILVLSGVTSNYYTKQVATHAALEVLLDDMSLQNDIDVR